MDIKRAKAEPQGKLVKTQKNDTFPRIIFLVVRGNVSNVLMTQRGLLEVFLRERSIARLAEIRRAGMKIPAKPPAYSGMMALRIPE